MNGNHNDMIILVIILFVLAKIDVRINFTMSLWNFCLQEHLEEEHFPLSFAHQFMKKIH